MSLPGARAHEPACSQDQAHMSQDDALLVAARADAATLLQALEQAGLFGGPEMPSAVLLRLLFHWRLNCGSPLLIYTSNITNPALAQAVKSRFLEWDSPTIEKTCLPPHPRRHPRRQSFNGELVRLARARIQKRQESRVPEACARIKARSQGSAEAHKAELDVNWANHECHLASPLDLELGGEALDVYDDVKPQAVLNGESTHGSRVAKCGHWYCVCGQYNVHKSICVECGATNMAQHFPASNEVRNLVLGDRVLGPIFQAGVHALDLVL